MSSQSVTFDKVDDSMSTACYENLVVLLFSGPMREAHLVAMTQLSDERLRTHPAGLVFVSMTADGMPAASLRLREPVREFSRRMGTRLVFSATIIRDDGIFAGARRAFLRGIMLLLGRTNLALVSNVEEAIERSAPAVCDPAGRVVERVEVERLLWRCDAELRPLRSGSAALP